MRADDDQRLYTELDLLDVANRVAVTLAPSAHPNVILNLVELKVAEIKQRREQREEIGSA